MSEKRFRTVVHWFRRDLRVGDNTALIHACRDADFVVPLLVVPHFSRRPDRASPFRDAFLWGCAVQLDARLEALGSRLIVRAGDDREELLRICRAFDGGAVYFNRAYEPGESARDRAVTADLERHGIRVVTFKDQVLFEPDEIDHLRPGGFRVYTAFQKALLGRRFDAPTPGPDTVASPASIRTAVSDWDGAAPRRTAKPDLEPGEDAARRRLDVFAGTKLDDYATSRDLLPLDGTSRLSAYLNAGAISVRAMADRAAGLGTGGDKWLSEILWREFYTSILWNFPHAERGPLRREFAAVAWHDDEQSLQAWKDGRTGYPVVDAAMRQLAATGWMHNRARMIAASFLTKDLLINWQHGERHFMELLTDGDLAQNNGGWQWSAGTGTDAQPWFRIFNPTLQGRKFDPDGAYVRRWVPELAAVPAAAIHAPWKMSPLEQEHLGCRIGRDYPAPIVDHAGQRGITLAAYKAATQAE
jgi:deoxyribodipyrimidine photo-lyase